MRLIKTVLPVLLLSFTSVCLAQKEKSNSDTRKFIENAEITQVNRDWNGLAEFKSGIGESVNFYPVEAIDLKTNKSIKSIQMDMYVASQVEGKSNYFFKSSWIDLDEVDEFVKFIEQYVIPNLNVRPEMNKSVTYIFNSKEIIFSFKIENVSRKISIYLKDNGVTDNKHYFWTESQVNKIPDLLKVLKNIIITAANSR
jgi:hypothetical protein